MDQQTNRPTDRQTNRLKSSSIRAQLKCLSRGREVGEGGSKVYTKKRRPYELVMQINE